eukprot:394669_1
MRGWLLVAIIVIMEANQVILDHNNDILHQKQNEPNRNKRSQLDNKIKVQCGATNCDEIMLKGNVSKHFKLYTTVNNEATYATKSNGKIGLFRKMAREYKRLYPSKQQSIISNPLRSKYNISKRMDASKDKPNVFKMDIPSDF